MRPLQGQRTPSPQDGQQGRTDSALSERRGSNQCYYQYVKGARKKMCPLSLNLPTVTPSQLFLTNNEEETDELRTMVNNSH